VFVVFRFNEKQDKQKLKEQLSDVGRQIELFDERQRQIEKFDLVPKLYDGTIAIDNGPLSV